MATVVEDPPVAQSPRRWLSVRRAVLALAVLAAAPVGAEAYRVMFGRNLHEVLPGRVYRCAQPDGVAIDDLVARHGIRTVINLRGSCDPFPWYLDEARATHRHNVAQEDVCFSAGRLPSVPELQRLVEILQRTEYPILLHCRRGADRTGLAAAIVLLLTTDMPYEEARSQLGPRYGHVSLGRPGQLDLFFDFYADWLRAEGKSHSNDVFREWAVNHYRPGSCWSELTWVSSSPKTVAPAQPTTLRLRARNGGIAAWQLKPVVTAGTHLGCHIYDEQDRLVDVVKTGLRDGAVAPGQVADFTLTVPPLRKPGRYRLQIDMVDEQQCWFYQTGSEPLEVELIVRD
jgi:protein tyrosine/serine phosphatase